MRCSAPLLASLFCLLAVPAAADYRLCNNTDYVLDAALAIELDGATATQGWFRVLPGGCRKLLSGDPSGERFFLHTTAPAAYGQRIEIPEVSRMLCVRGGDFLLSRAEACSGGEGRLAPFTEVTPDVAGPGATELAGAHDGDADAARRAGLARLLNNAGYNTGAGLDSALSDFRSAAGLAPDAGDAELFRALLEHARGGTNPGTDKLR